MYNSCLNKLKYKNFLNKLELNDFVIFKYDSIQMILKIIIF